MRKTRIIFIALTLYILIAFGWWTIAHIRSSRIIRQQTRERLELLCYKASVEINGLIGDKMFNDTTELRTHFDKTYPQLEILLDEGSGFENFLIRPKQYVYVEIDALFRRKVWMYLTEGLVMVGVLFWGIIWVY